MSVPAANIGDMADKHARLVLESDPNGTGMRFDATGGRGIHFAIDTSESDGGPTPAELLPVALAGCTAFDVISILRKKRQNVSHYEVTAHGVQREGVQPAIFTLIDVTHVVEGEVEVAAVRRAIELSATKYCSVGGTLATGATEIRHGFVLRHADGTEESGVVVVQGARVVA